MDKESKRLKEKEVARQLMIDDVVKVLATQKNGREFLWWLLEIGGIGTQPFTQDPYLTAFQCGTLNVGQQILARLTTVTPEGYLGILTEKNDDERRARSERATGSGREPDGEGYPDDDAGATGEYSLPVR